MESSLIGALSSPPTTSNCAMLLFTARLIPARGNSKQESDE
jgi:hypothetical protein